MEPFTTMMLVQGGQSLLQTLGGYFSDRARAKKQRRQINEAVTAMQNSINRAGQERRDAYSSFVANTATDSRNAQAYAAAYSDTSRQLSGRQAGLLDAITHAQLQRPVSPSFTSYLTRGAGDFLMNAAGTYMLNKAGFFDPLTKTADPNPGVDDVAPTGFSDKDVWRGQDSWLNWRIN